jgi:hypothetical protein
MKEITFNNYVAFENFDIVNKKYSSFGYCPVSKLHMCGIYVVCNIYNCYKYDLCPRKPNTFVLFDS